MKCLKKFNPKKKGEWVIVHPTDCMTMLPVYQCSNCGKLTSGYDPEPICIECESYNVKAINKSISIPIFDKTF